MKTATPTCTACQSPFTVSVEDQEFLERLSPIIDGKTYLLPSPTLCPDCREQRRLAVANQLFLYRRTCDLTGETVVSNIHEDSPYTVYKQELWHSDAWDPMSYGVEYDFKRPFFEQWHDLSLKVPRPSLFTGYQYDENSDYTNHSGKNKNCYMIFDSDENRDCYYCYSLNGSQSCLECFRVRKSELCYGCIDALHCYASSFLQDCENCSDSMFLKNCIGCKHCLMSSNLRNKEYFVENKKVTKEEFARVKALLTSRQSITAAMQRFDALKLEYPQKFMHGVQNENVIGDYLTNCKNAYQCFDSTELWDCRYVYQAFMPLKDSMDIQECGDGEKIYESAFVGYGGNNVQFSAHVLGDSSDLLYCCYCPHSKNLFGCIGLRHKQYCIFNTQYTKEEYGALVPRIIEHMRTTSEWGEFFPIKYSYACYNETLAQDYFPLTRDEALKRGYSWREADPKTTAKPSATVPEEISGAEDSITHELLACSECKKNYRIIAQELALYKQMNLPLPDTCFDCRLKAKRALRNPRSLQERQCMKCGVTVHSTYAQERPEIVYCEQCYLDSLQ